MMIVSLEKIIYLQFKADNSFLKIKIVDQKLNPFNPTNSNGILVVKDAPIAQALLGHKAGETVEFKIEDKWLQVEILKII